MTTNNENQAKQDRIIRRIKACLALSQSDNEHEAASALRQAQLLMQKHNIDLEEASQPDFEIQDGSEGKRSKSSLSQPEMLLYGVVCRFFGCSLYSNKNWPVIVGTAPAPQIAEYAATTLLRQLRQNRKNALEALEEIADAKLSTSHKREFNATYSMTWVSAVHTKIAEFAQNVNDQTKAQHMQAVQKHSGSDTELKSRKMRKNHRETAVSEYAQHVGAQDGSKAELNHGVSQGPQQAQIAG